MGEMTLAARTGREPRVLHVGNVANNAYLNVKILEGSGVDCDVLCHGNYHFMASPEWEEIDEAQTRVDEERPDWDAIAPHEFTRPRWFAQGPLGVTARYLEARRSDRQWLADGFWQVVEARRRAIAGSPGRSLRRLRRRSPVAAPIAATGATSPTRDQDDRDAYAAQRQWNWSRVQALLSHYDLVHAYGAEPILPYAVGKRPYVAWEHGTLRQLPFQPTPEGRLTAQAYRHADAVVITNADNRASAERLGLTRFRFIPHPVSERRPDPASAGALRARLRERLGAEFLVFHPSRQHWNEEERNPHLEKGNDFLIRALASFCQARPGAAAVFVDWGATVAQSRALIASLGLESRVLWVPPQPGLSLARYMLACDVVADQFYLGAFGSTMPRALYLERAALIHLDVAAHQWCLPDMPPVINAQTPAGIHAGLIKAHDDRGWLADLAARGRAWYDTYHSNAVVRRMLLELYGELMSPMENRLATVG